MKLNNNIFITAFSLLFFTQCGLFERNYRSPYEACEQLNEAKSKESNKIIDNTSNLPPKTAAATGIATGASLSTIYKSESCEIPKNISLKIACTQSCSDRHKKILSELAKQLHYQVEFIKLNSDEGLKGFNAADAIIIEGGLDISHHLYDSKYGKKGLPSELLKTINAGIDEDIKINGKNKDFFEMEFLKKYFQEEQFERIPLLGIARGMHLLAVAQGLPLYADVNIQLKVENPQGSVEEIKLIEQESDIMHILQKSQVDVLEKFHQALNTDYYNKSSSEFNNITPTATSHNNNIIEVIEFKNRKAMGTQFYPELSGPALRNALYSWFLVKSCQGKLQVISQNGEIK